MADDTLAHGEPVPLDPGGSGGRRAVGPYRLLRRLGEGGMGEVWLAEQTEPIRRTVAVKLIKAGMDTRRVVARFEAERQALAMMEHPAIARVLDGGSTAEGRPYFVMELVEGEPLLAYCDAHRLSTRKRLELFVAVCDGVRHAHQKAVIHRDLKPSNVLVATVDGRPQPRIIDFGIAKAVRQRLGENALETEVGVLVGTPEYMSPEQADPAGADVDTRADVYSLGVMLYELLTGSLPFASPGLRGATPPELRRRLLAADARAPSACLLASEGRGSAAAASRGTTPEALVREVRGDLDAIVLKAMEKERERRYASVADLADDVGRVLRDVPVRARPASAGYRLRKYVRRHRSAVALGVAVALALPAFTIALAVQVRKVSRERDRANREAEAATRIAGFLSGIFKVSDPSEARGNTLTAREALDRAAREIETGLVRDPELQARLMGTMGTIYGDLGLPAASRPLLQRALETRTRLLGPDAPETIDSRIAWGTLLSSEGSFRDAEAFDRETVARSLRALGPGHRLTLAAQDQLATAILFQGRYPEAESMLREVVEVGQRVYGPDAPEIMPYRLDLADTLSKQHRVGEAAAIRASILETYRRIHGPDHPRTMAAVANLANDLYEQGDLARAADLQLQVLDSSRRVYGPKHPNTLELMVNLANTRAAQKDYAEAERINREALAIELEARGPAGRTAGIVRYNLLCEAALQHHREDALRYLREAVQYGMPEEIVRNIDQDPDLESLRGDRTYGELVAQLKARPAP